MRTITTTCERCGHQKVEKAGEAIGDGFTYVNVEVSEVYKPKGRLFRMDQMEVCTSCAEALRALIAAQVRRWKSNRDHFTTAQLQAMAAEDGTRSLV